MMEITWSKIYFPIALFILTFEISTITGKALDPLLNSSTSPNIIKDSEDHFSSTFSATVAKPSTLRDVKVLSVNEVLINEICEDDVFQDHSKTYEQNQDESGLLIESKITRKERLLCAILKSQNSIRNLPTQNPTKMHNSEHELNETEEMIFLPKDYNKLAAPVMSTSFNLPNGTVTTVPKPVNVYAYLNIRSVRDVNEDKEEVTLDMDMLLLWVDGHILNLLKQRNVTLDKLHRVEDNLRPISAGLAGKIWQPDLFFQEVVLVNRPVVLDTGTTILFNPNLGAVVIKARFFVTLVCGMDFFYYPADTQRCQFHLRSGGHSSSELEVKWWRNKAHGVFLHETSDPNFDIRVTEISEYDAPVDLGPETRTARNTSHLKFEIYIRRKMSYHLVQTYLPSVFFIIVTWLCFLIPVGMLEARIGVSMTTLLTLTSMFSSIRENTQVVSYVKAIDIWMVTCVFFIFLVLLTFTTEAWIRGTRKRLQATKDNLAEEPSKHRRRTRGSVQVFNMMERCIDRFAAWTLFCSFVVFNVGYWCWLLIYSEHLIWDIDEKYNAM